VSIELWSTGSCKFIVVHYLLYVRYVGNSATLAKFHKHVVQEFASNTVTLRPHKQIGDCSHNVKDKFLLAIFRAFVKSNRATNGKTSGLVKFWLDSKYKNLKFHPERKDAKPEDSFFESFKTFISYLHTKSKYNITHKCYCLLSLTSYN